MPPRQPVPTLPPDSYMNVLGHTHARTTPAPTPTGVVQGAAAPTLGGLRPSHAGPLGASSSSSPPPPHTTSGRHANRHAGALTHPAVHPRSPTHMHARTHPTTHQPTFMPWTYACTIWMAWVGSAPLANACKANSGERGARRRGAGALVQHAYARVISAHPTRWPQCPTQYRMHTLGRLRWGGKCVPMGARCAAEACPEGMHASTAAGANSSGRNAKRTSRQAGTRARGVA